MVCLKHLKSLLCLYFCKPTPMRRENQYKYRLLGDTNITTIPAKADIYTMGQLPYSDSITTLS